MKITIYQTDAHDHVAVFLDDKVVYQNDYDPEAVILLADHLGWEWEIITLTGEEYEQRFA